MPDSGRAQTSTVPFGRPSHEKEIVPFMTPGAGVQGSQSEQGMGGEEGVKPGWSSLAEGRLREGSQGVTGDSQVRTEEKLTRWLSLWAFLPAFRPLPRNPGERQGGARELSADEG